jgi:hypothetical protein
LGAIDEVKYSYARWITFEIMVVKITPMVEALNNFLGN